MYSSHTLCISPSHRNFAWSFHEFSWDFIRSPSSRNVPQPHERIMKIKAVCQSFCPPFPVSFAFNTTPCYFLRGLQSHYRPGRDLPSLLFVPSRSCKRAADLHLPPTRGLIIIISAWNSHWNVNLYSHWSKPDPTPLP